MAYLRAYQAMGDPSIMRQMRDLGMRKIRGRGMRNFGRGVGRAVRTIRPVLGFVPGGSTVAGLVGDPGLGSLLGRLGGAAARVFGKAAGSPLGKMAGSLLMGGGAVGALGGLAAGVAIPAAVRGVQGLMGGSERGRSRRMNVTNVKALRRSMRRVEGFAKLAKSTISFTKQTRMKPRGRKR